MRHEDDGVPWNPVLDDALQDLLRRDAIGVLRLEVLLDAGHSMFGQVREAHHREQWANVVHLVIKMR
eukprot:3598832-Pleurochrysis_carterae.AAC.1